jgi:RNA-binding protein
MLTSKQRSFLRGLGHDKKPVVMIGKLGLTEAVTKEAKAALLAHELIKVKLGKKDEDGDAEEDVSALAAEFATAIEAELVGVAGKMALYFKAHPHKPVIKLPRDPSEPKPKKKGLFDLTEE